MYISHRPSIGPQAPRRRRWPSQFGRPTLRPGPAPGPTAAAAVALTNNDLVTLDLDIL